MKATYIDHMGSDLTVVNAARVSFAKQSEWDEGVGEDEHGTFLHDALSDKDAKLIAYLARHQHWTPFAHPQITLHIKAPIFVRTQCFKHKVGFTENEVSRRYVDSPPEFYAPDIWRKRAVNKKQGSSQEAAPDQRDLRESYDDLIAAAQRCYEAMLAGEVAPEQARMVLPQSMMTEWYWTGSLAAYARFVRQRTHDGAQEETADIARQCAAIIEPLFPVAWAALVEGRPDRPSDGTGQRC